MFRADLSHRVVCSGVYKVKLRKRNFLKGLALLTLNPFLDTLGAVSEFYPKKERWLILSSVNQVLLPETNGCPGAAKLNSTEFIFNILSYHPIEQEEKDFILNGIKWINQLSKVWYKKSFYQCNLIQQNKMISHIVLKESGKQWLEIMLYYLLQSVICAPIYGGNKDELGWKWLDYHPGFPIPMAKKDLYYNATSYYTRA